PLIALCQSTPIPIIDIPLFNNPMISAPIMVPNTVPIPPLVEAPPIYTAAKASNSNPSPAWGVAAFNLEAKISPAKADIKPILTKIQNSILPTFTPDNYAALQSP